MNPNQPPEHAESSLDIIIPERFRHAHWEGFRQAVERGHTRHGGLVRTTRSIHKNGGKLYVDLSFGLVTNGDGSVIGAVAVGRDCTARYLAESDRRARLAELERQANAGPDSAQLVAETP